MRIIFSKHALTQMDERGADRNEVRETIMLGEKIPAKKDRESFRYNFQFNGVWLGRRYRTKQVVPVVKAEAGNYIVITVYVFYF